MLDFEIITVSRYDGTSRTEKAIEVFNCVTGEVVEIVRRRHFETKQAWIDRAFARANETLISA